MSDENREELVVQLRALRRNSRGIVRAILAFECHNRMCSVQDAELDAQLVRKDGRSREVRRGGWGVCE